MQSESKRVQMEKETIQKMISIYCKGKHKREMGLCSECSNLTNYSIIRLANCRLGEDKPVCGKCKIHCYIPEMRVRIINVMRYSGPRMIFLHPILSFYHFRQTVRR